MWVVVYGGVGFCVVVLFFGKVNVVVFIVWLFVVCVVFYSLLCYDRMLGDVDWWWISCEEVKGYICGVLLMVVVWMVLVVGFGFFVDLVIMFKVWLVIGLLMIVLVVVFFVVLLGMLLFIGVVGLIVVVVFVFVGVYEMVLLVLVYVIVVLVGVL